MKLDIRVRPAAESDVEELFHWYEEQSPGLGRRFVNELDVVYARIQVTPRIYATLYRGIRRAMLKRFPVGVFYVEKESVVKVVAVNHLARNPSVWQRRN
ncbi:MAG: type II toxin-antitoxin system RelE/ParE family toxin [Gammaproteobacteria bacterium]|nr:type II toxin-antitoxin system RelE/ParE family toxin [Gammaproteobacteria bacterium]